MQSSDVEAVEELLGVYLQKFWRAIVGTDNTQ